VFRDSTARRLGRHDVFDATNDEQLARAVELRRRVDSGRRGRQLEEMQVNVATQAAAVAAAGVLLGLFITIMVRRRTTTSQQASGRWRAVYAGAMLVCAALLLFIAITEPTRRYVNIAIAVALVATAIWQLRKTKPVASPPQGESGHPG
jgi:hypothetical protein